MTVGKIKYHDKRAFRKSKRMDKGKEPSHFWYDEKGEKLSFTKSKMLNKVKSFLEKAEDQVSEEQTEGNVSCHGDMVAEGYSSDSSSSSKDSSQQQQIESGSHGKLEQTEDVDSQTEENAVSKKELSEMLRADCGTVKNVSHKKKKKKNRKKVKMPPEVANSEDLRKYWAQRYRLFSRFDEGVRLDRGGYALSE